MGRPAAGFRGDIEGLRGVAVLLVVFGHVTGWPRGGFIGVDVFFVISGYLITGLLVAERERTGRISIPGFYARRARRLLPAGVLVLAVTDMAASLLLLPSRAHETFVDSLWAFGFLANVHFARLGTDYFSLTRAPSAVQHYWSLSVEEQFYLVWPALILLTFAAAGRLRGRRALTAVAGVAVAASLAWSVVSTQHSPASAYFSSPARAWELGAGALLVLLSPKRVPGFVAWIGAAGLVVAAVVITPATAVPGYALVLPVASTVAILAAGGERLGLATAPIRYVGLISYSLYLWHWPVLVLGATLRGGTGALGKALLLLTAGLLSVASYHLVEQPFRRRRPQRVPGPSAASVAAPAYAMVLIAALGVTWVLSDSPAARQSARHVAPPVGAEPVQQVPDLATQIQQALQLSRWPAGLDADLTDAGSPEWLHDNCLDIGDKNAQRCTYGPPHATRTVALLGDSVAVSWMPALRRAATMRNSRIHVLTLRQCANLRGLVSRGCAGHQNWALQQVRRLRPDLVVMSARYQGPQTPVEWREGTARMLAELAPYTKRVIVLAPPPGTGNLQSCFTRLSKPRDCAAQVSERWRTYAGAELQAATAAHAFFLDPRPWFCLADQCPAVVDELPVLFDGRHLTAVYAAAIAPAMAPAFR